MEEFERVQHIDFVWRSRHPDSNMPKGYWFITQISIPISVAIWRKRSDDAWVRLSPDEIPFESQIVESGNLVKHKDGTVYAAGQVKERLDETLRIYMEKKDLNKHPYVYWNLTG
jgi:hypothetical protein